MVRLIPKDVSFFAMFSNMADNLISGAQVLVNLFADYRDVEKSTIEIKRIATSEKIGSATFASQSPAFTT